MCAYKADSLLQVFATILKMLSTQGANRVDYGILLVVLCFEKTNVPFFTTALVITLDVPIPIRILLCQNSF